MKVFIRFEFGNYHRYSHSFDVKFIPPIEQHKELCEGLLKLQYLHDPEVKELYQKYGLTGAEIETEKQNRKLFEQITLF